MQAFRSLKVWQNAHDLSLDIYKLTTGFPKVELYGLTIQLRRATTPIPTNIAEGSGRHGDAEFARFLQIAMASACEVEYLLLLSCELGYLSTLKHKRVHKRLVEVKKMLTGLIQAVRTPHRHAES